MTNHARRAARAGRVLVLLLALTPPFPHPAAGAEADTTDCRRPHGCFSDTDLHSLLEASRVSRSSGLIYVWSPHMSYSVRGAKEIFEVARSLGLELTVLLDPLADRELAVDVVRREHIDARALRALDSRELHARGILLHLPAFVLYEDGRFAEPVYRGYKPRSRLVRILEERM